ncbi:phosphotransferase [Oceanobacillus kapialis]|uniref:Phosphotransferase n=1 Tax=Oceanobacillus kapialis TaxID=481353 RepID=A0ABW5Q5A4_9BACI
MYNIQTYIPNYKKATHIDFYNLGKVISLFHSETQRIQGIIEQVDRFSLGSMWESLKYDSDFAQVNFRRQLEVMVEKSIGCQHENNCFIHGDLATWNIITNDKNIYIIDFGEVRRENNHFDISALISSFINIEESEEKITTSLTNFREGYIENFAQFDWILLSENLNIWSTRGVIALLVHNGIDSRTCKMVNKIIEDQARLNNIIRRLAAKYQGGK